MRCERARGRFSPFLRDALERRPELVDAVRSSRAARPRIAAALARRRRPVEAELRRQRARRCALALALGDLAGRAALEAGDAAAVATSPTARSTARSARRSPSARPGAEPPGFAVLALGKLGSRELNYSSDVDLIFLFDPATLPRRAREEPDEAAVRIGRRVVELLQKRTADGYVVARRPAACARRPK